MPINGHYATTSGYLCQTAQIGSQCTFSPQKTTWNAPESRNLATYHVIQSADRGAIILQTRLLPLLPQQIGGWLVHGKPS